MVQKNIHKNVLYSNVFIHEHVFLCMKIANDLCLSFPGLFRFQVAIFHVRDNDTGCSGSIINPSDTNFIKLCYFCRCSKEIF